MKKTILAFCMALLCSASLMADDIDRIEPPCWWVGMDTDLQLMLHGDHITGSTVSTDPEIKWLSVGTVTSVGNPNYLFVEVRVSRRLAPGKYKFHLETPDGRQSEFEYEFLQRREGSAKRVSFGPQDAVYLLMPDRFANGDRKNDSSEEAAEPAGPSIPAGRHGGDIQGIIDHLDDIAGLGATTIWSTPLLFDNEDSYSYHGYACADYYRVDPRYGSNELYRKFVSKAHGKGLKVIMDMVPNHCGTAHWWMQDMPSRTWVNYPDNLNREDEAFVRTNSALTAHTDPHAAEIDKERYVKGWFDTTMPDLNLADPLVRQYMLQVAVWWIEWADLDGLRVDTFPFSDKDAIADWTKSIRKEYKNINIVGEVWAGDVPSCAYWEGVRQKDGYNSNLPSVMDFPLMFSLLSALRDEDGSAEPGMMKIYNTLSLDRLYGNPSSLLIFAGNHDTPRLAHELGGDMDKIRMAYTLLATMRGVPQLYYGDEYALTSADGTVGHSQERVDMPWGGFSKEQLALRSYISGLFNWRKTSKAVAKGNMIHFRPDDRNVYVYFRTFKDESVMVVLNGGKEDFTIDWDHYSEITSKIAAKGRNIINGERVKVGDAYVVGPGAAAIIEFR